MQERDIINKMDVMNHVPTMENYFQNIVVLIKIGRGTLRLSAVYLAERAHNMEQ